MNLRSLALFLAVTLGACGDNEFWVTIEFPDQASRERATVVEVFALEPAEDSTCDSLTSGQSRPGDPGYQVEAQVAIAMPALEQDGALRNIGPGPRLFFAQARDQDSLAYLSGCTPAQAAGSGPQEVTIVLQSTCQPSRGGVEWCDGLDNDCDGVIDGPDCLGCQDDQDCSDPDSCLAGTCLEGTCNYTQIPDGEICDDGLYCTVDDRCSDGTCQGTPRDCSSLEDECSQGVCDEVAGACAQDPRPDGTGCNDQQWCTVGDNCMAGVCSGSPRHCNQPDQECFQAHCNEAEKKCEERPLEDGSPCDDGLYCSEGETCQAQVCDGGQPRDCSASGGACIDGSCDEESDACIGDFLPDGSECNDDLYCTENDRCDGAGNCQGSPRDCSHLAGPCAAGVCDEAAEACLAEPIHQGLACDDGLYCTTNTTCDQGNCAGEEIDCSHLDDQCLQGACEETSQQCQARPINQGNSCDDGDPCSSSDSCQAGSCVAGASDLDADQDGYIDDQCPGGVDCDDGDESVHPGATEGPVCAPDASCFDGLDNNCNDLTDAAEEGCQASGYICLQGPENPVQTGAPGDTLTVRLDDSGYDPADIVCYTDTSRLLAPEILMANDFETDLNGFTITGSVSRTQSSQNPASSGSFGARICDHNSSVTVFVDTTGRQRIQLRYAAEGSLSFGVFLITEYSPDTGTNWYPLDIQGDDFSDDDFQWFTHILPPGCEDLAVLSIRIRVRGTGFSDCAYLDDFSVSDLPQPTTQWSMYANGFEVAEGNSTADICDLETIALFAVQSSDNDVCLLQAAQNPGSAGNQGLALVDNDPTMLDFDQVDTSYVPPGSDLVCSFAMTGNNLAGSHYANAWYNYDGANYIRMNGVGAGTRDHYDWFRFVWEPESFGRTGVSASFFIPLNAGTMDQTNGIFADDFELGWHRASHDVIGGFSDQGDGSYQADIQSDLAGTANVTCIFHGSTPPLVTDGQGNNSGSFPVTFFE